MHFLWKRRSISWEFGVSLFLMPGDYVRLDVNLGWWALVIGKSFKPKDVQDEN